jgi:putative ABC transport system permease protein
VLFLLLLPALNIIGLTLTQFRKRRPEIGVRKAFGARASSLVTQVVTENMLYSLIGGVLGLLLSYALLTLCKPYLLGGAELNVTMLLRLGTILTALFFTFLMNLLSVGLPALRAARMPVVKALNDMD